jgi:hypothetical protein
LTWVGCDWLDNNRLGDCEGHLGSGVSVCFLTIFYSKPIPVALPFFQTNTEAVQSSLSSFVVVRHSKQWHLEICQCPYWWRILELGRVWLAWQQPPWGL